MKGESNVSGLSYSRYKCNKRGKTERLGRITVLKVLVVSEDVEVGILKDVR